MNPNLQKQILIGLIAGLLVSGIAYLLMGGKRDELAALTAKVTQLAFSALTPDNVNVNLMRPISRWVRRLQWPTCSPNHPGVPGPRIRAHQVAEILFSD